MVVCQINGVLRRAATTVVYSQYIFHNIFVTVCIMAISTGPNISFFHWKQTIVDCSDSSFWLLSFVHTFYTNGRLYDTKEEIWHSLWLGCLSSRNHRIKKLLTCLYS